MSNLITTATQAQFNSEVKAAYKLYGSVLQNTVRNKKDNQKNVILFQPIDYAVAQEKDKIDAQISTNGRDSKLQKCYLSSFYTGQWVSSSVNFSSVADERLAIARSSAHAIGVATDKLIVNALKSQKNSVIKGAPSGITKANVMSCLEVMNKNRINDDGQRFCILGWKQWENLMSEDSFYKLPYINPDGALGMSQSKSWMGVRFIVTSNVDNDLAIMYHKNNVGYGYNDMPESDITWHGDKDSYFVNTKIDHGAISLDKSGVVHMEFK